jgi:hypothetical protein
MSVKALDRARTVYVLPYRCLNPHRLRLIRIWPRAEPVWRSQ